MLHLKVILAPHFFYVSNHERKRTNHVHTQKRSNNEKDSIVEYGFSDYTTSVFVFVVFAVAVSLDGFVSKLSYFFL